MFNNQYQSPIVQKSNELLQQIAKSYENQYDSYTLGQIYDMASSELPNLLSEIQRRYGTGGVPVSVLHEAITRIWNQIQTSISQSQYGGGLSYNNTHHNLNLGPMNHTMQPALNSNPTFQHQLLSQYDHTSPLTQPQAPQYQQAHDPIPSKIDNQLPPQPPQPETTHSHDQIISIISGMNAVRLESIPRFENILDGITSLNSGLINKNHDMLIGEIDYKKPYIKLTNFIQDVQKNKPCLFSQKQDETSLIKVNSERYFKFTGTARKAYHIIGKLSSFDPDDPNVNNLKNTISAFTNNNHEIVKSVEKIIIKRINELLIRYIRLSKEITIKYQISEMCDLPELIALPNTSSDGVLNHTKYLKTINEIIHKVFNEVINGLILPEKRNIPHFVLADVNFGDVDMFSYSDNTDAEYMRALNESGLLFKLNECNILSTTTSGRFTNNKEEFILTNLNNLYEGAITRLIKDNDELSTNNIIIYDKENNVYDIKKLGLTLDNKILIT
jgi:hypothetical protein